MVQLWYLRHLFLCYNLYKSIIVLTLIIFDLRFGLLGILIKAGLL